MIISSRKNSLFQKFLSLNSAKGIREEGLCLLAGQKITDEYWKASLRNTKGDASVPNESPDLFWISSPKHTYVPKASRNVVFSEDLFEDLDSAGSHHPLLCLPTPKIHRMEMFNPQKPSICTGLGDPSNTGALLRSASAFGISQIVLLKESANPFLPRSLRASSGYACHLEYFKGPSIQELDTSRWMGLHMEGEPLSKVSLNANLQFVVGEEGKGLPSSFAGQKVSIPMTPLVESLNASVSVGILLFEWRRQHPLKGES